MAYAVHIFINSRSYCSTRFHVEGWHRVASIWKRCFEEFEVSFRGISQRPKQQSGHEEERVSSYIFQSGVGLAAAAAAGIVSWPSLRAYTRETLDRPLWHRLRLFFLLPFHCSYYHQLVISRQLAWSSGAQIFASSSVRCRKESFLIIGGKGHPGFGVILYVKSGFRELV